MNTEKMFEIATRSKIRFPYKGMITVEDLWDLPITELDTVFKKLNTQMKKSQEESLLDVRSKEDETIELQISIIKYIVNVKKNEQISRAAAKEKNEKKQMILQIMEERKAKEIESMSTEELRKMLDELDE
jgi:hypothetical protein cdifQCD-6_20935